MRPFLAILLLAISFLSLPACPQAFAEYRTIVPPHEQISDLDARLALARLLSWDPPAERTERDDGYALGNYLVETCRSTTLAEIIR